ncbi:MAG: signal recognition particle protein [Alphaproteobacteria bacterium]|nr:signal recognition particle protein [Alphaproteobacteria bacterium]MBL0717673.1 signal recognition particle protein [Alphaproteobacteria bacterium]
MFDGITRKITGVFDKISGGRRLSESVLQTVLRELKVALLESDVPVGSVDNIIAVIGEKFIGEKVTRSVSAKEEIIKITHDTLLNILTDKDDKDPFGKAPSISMLIGLQGTGKTTTTVKLANLLNKKGSKVLVVSTDIYRPQAKEQLSIMSDKNNVDSVRPIKDEAINKTLERALAKFKEEKFDHLLIDTAGRLSLDPKMMQELKDIYETIKPNNVILTLNAMSGKKTIQDALTFHDNTTITHAILSSVDADSNGGIALALRHIVRVPLIYVGTGEDIEDIDKFHPERFVKQILGHGDVVSLVEKIQDKVDIEDTESFIKKMTSGGEFSLDDMLSQIRQIKKMGSITKIASFIPGLSKFTKQLEGSGDAISKQENLILSMTKNERRNPQIIFISRKERIAKGAGRSVSDVEQLLKAHKNMANMFKNMPANNGDPSDMLKGLQGQMPQGIDMSKMESMVADMQQNPSKFNDLMSKFSSGKKDS